MRILHTYCVIFLVATKKSFFCGFPKENTKKYMILIYPNNKDNLTQNEIILFWHFVTELYWFFILFGRTHRFPKMPIWDLLWYIYDGNSKNVTHVWRKAGLFRKKIRFVTRVNLNKGIKKISVRILNCNW